MSGTVSPQDDPAKDPDDGAPGGADVDGTITSDAAQPGIAQHDAARTGATRLTYDDDDRAGGGTAERIAALRARLMTPMPNDGLWGWIGPLLVTAFAQPFMAFATVAAMALRGAGDTRTVLGSTVICVVVVRLAATYLFVVVLGLGLASYGKTPGGSFAAFFRCSPRHHSFAVVSGDHHGFHHLMIENQHLDDVGVAFDLARKSGTPIISELGNGHGCDIA